MANPPYDNRTDAEKQQSVMSLMQQQAMGAGNEYMDGFSPRSSVPESKPISVVPDDTGLMNINRAIDEASSAPSVQNQASRQRNKVEFGLDTNIGGPYSNSDFMPPGSEGIRYQSAGVGRYGADILPMPQAGIIPMSVISGRMAAKQKELDAEKAKREAFDAYKLKEVNRAWANEVFSDTARADIEGLIDSTVSYYAGDEATAYAKLMDPNSREGRNLANKQRQWNNVAAKINDLLADALAIVEGTRNGTLKVDPETSKLATELHYGLGNFKDMGIEKLSEISDSFENRLSMVKYIQERDVVKRLHDAAGITAQGPNAVKDKKTGLFLVTTDHVTDFENALKSEVENMYEVYRGMGVSRDEVEKMLRGYASTQVERKVNVVQPRAPKGGGSGSQQGWNMGYSRTFIKPDNEGIPENLVLPQDGQVDAVKLIDQTANKGAYPSARPFQAADGTPIAISPLEVIRDANGDLWIHGKQQKERGAAVARASGGSDGQGGDIIIGGAKDNAAASQGVDTRSSYGAPETMRFDELPDVFVPYNDGRVDNSTALFLAFPGMNEKKLMDMFPPMESKKAAKADAGGQKKATIPDFVKKAGYSQEEWDSLDPAVQQQFIKAGKLPE